MRTMTLSDDSSVPETEQHLSYTTLRLGAEDETVALHGAAKAALTTLRGDATCLRDATELRMAKRAILGSRTKDLYGSLSALSRKTLAELDNDRTDPRFVHAFPKPVSEVLDGAISDEKLNYCQVAIDHLSAEASLTGLAPALADAQAKVDAVKAGRADHAAAIAAEAAASATLKRSLSVARDLYNTLFANVTVLFPKRKGFVNTFFLNREKRPAPVDEQVG